MSRASIRGLAIVCLASIGLGTPANAAFIFAFGQSDPTNTGVITASGSGNTTTLTTSSATANPGSVPILISQEGNLNVAVPAVETFVGVTATGPVSSTIVGGSTQLTESVSGLINFNLPGPGGLLVLSIQFNNSVLEGSGNSGDIRGSQPGTGTVTLIAGPAGGAIAAAVGVGIGQPFSGAFSNSLVGVNPAFAITGTTIAGFTANTAGNVSPSPAIPEPASFVMMGTSVLTGLGVFGWRRRKVSRV